MTVDCPIRLPILLFEKQVLKIDNIGHKSVIAHFWRCCDIRFDLTGVIPPSIHYTGFNFLVKINSIVRVLKNLRITIGLVKNLPIQFYGQAISSRKKRYILKKKI